ncbi:MAG: bifunctional folylpolyglutamate synthase/dihydrofolate synthase [Clostridia bacterium]|nr:bifunctional folylpolyglutamate synthase/dihydrofolate synthase [Clostridia bacterium]
MTYEKALEYIHSVSWKGSRPGLERTRELLTLMGNPEKKLSFIHIAGTNGKGSTASMSANVLLSAGYKVGLYTSPFIFEFNERMRVNGENISNQELAEITEFVMPLAESMEDKPTEFELVTCIAFEYFYRHRCDIVCLEVGMGGELDSTNVIEPPVASVITNIGLDHTEFLGDTLEKIAETKSKIIKENSIAVVYPSTPSVEEVIEKRCKEVNSLFLKADFEAVVPVSASLEFQEFDWKGLKSIKLHLLGEHQLKNVATVLTLMEALRSKGFAITDQAIREGIETAVWQGRFEVVSHNPLFVVDGGHNPQCIESLVKNVKSYITQRPLIVLTGVLADKDYNSMYSEMSSLADEFVTVTPPNPRALTSDKLAEYIISLGKKATPCNSIAEGVALAKAKAGERGAVLAYGSLYMVADVEQNAKAFCNEIRR